MSNFYTHYDTLKVQCDAPLEIIKAAYKALAQKYHPDRNSSSEAARLMIEINAAYETLSDSSKRAIYDRWLIQQEIRQRTTQNEKQQTKSVNSNSDSITIHINKALLATVKNIIINSVKFLCNLILGLWNAIENFIHKVMSWFVKIIPYVAVLGIIVAITISLYAEYRKENQTIATDESNKTNTSTADAIDANLPLTPESEFVAEIIPPEPLPLTGDTDTPDLQGVAPLEIKVSQGNNYLVKVEDAYNHAPLASFFIRSGETLNTKVPLGNYIIKYAYGEQWYGLEKLFGSQTGYAKAEDILNFSFTGDGYSGHTIELILQANGNLETSHIAPNEF